MRAQNPAQRDAGQIGHAVAQVEKDGSLRSHSGGWNGLKFHVVLGGGGGEFLLWTGLEIQGALGGGLVS